ncbi:MAG: zinc transporter ZntB, partial [Vallitaleaceae bacterium]|nr:zinc transporter ZntB [Vallitaleaceae bacterium]
HKNKEIKASKDLPVGQFTWMHLDASKPGIMEWLQSSIKLSKKVIDELLSEENRPQFRYYEGGILVTLRSVNFDDFVDPSDLGSIHVWIEKDRIISIAKEQIMAIEDIAREIEEKRGPVDAEDFLIQLIIKINKRIVDIVAKIEDEVDQVEDLILDEINHESRKALSLVRRNMIVLRRYILPQRDMLLRMFAENLGGKYKVMIRDAGEKLVRCIEDLDVARDRAMLIQEEITNRISEQMNKTMYTMTMVATIFLPLTFLTGLLGINVGGIPGSDNPIAFVIVCFVAVGIAIAEYLFFKRKHYL